MCLISSRKLLDMKEYCALLSVLYAAYQNGDRTETLVKIY
jgi:hypothetical protein